MTHAAFPAPTILAAASAVHDRLKATADAEGLRSINPAALYLSADLVRFAGVVGGGAIHLDLDDFGLLADDLQLSVSADT